MITPSFFAHAATGCRANTHFNVQQSDLCFTLVKYSTISLRWQRSFGPNYRLECIYPSLFSIGISSLLILRQFLQCFVQPDEVCFQLRQVGLPVVEPEIEGLPELRLHPAAQRRLEGSVQRLHHVLQLHAGLCPADVGLFPGGHIVAGQIDDDMDMNALPKTNYIKTIVTAEAKLDLERKGVQSYQRDIYARFLCFGNGALTSLYDHSDGFFRRQLILTTKDKPADRTDDPFLVEKMCAELEGILLWCLEGLHRLVQNDFRFTVSERAAANVDTIKRSSNNVIDFMESEGYFRFKADYSMHYIRYDVLYTYILARVQYWSQQAQQDGDKLLQRLLNASDKERNTAKKKQTAELKKATKRKAEVDNLFAKMYEDWSVGRITEYNFNMLSEKYQAEQHELDEKIQELQAELDAAVQTAVDAEKWIELMKKYVNPTQLTAELLNALIEKILIHEAVKHEDGTREQEVEIFYRFIGKVE